MRAKPSGVLQIPKNRYKNRLFTFYRVSRAIRINPSWKLGYLGSLNKEYWCNQCYWFEVMGLIGAYMLRILIVDNNVLFREGLTNLLEKENGIRVAGCFGSILEVIGLLPQLKPDVILVDADLPDLEGQNGFQAIRHHCPQAQVAMMSTHQSEELLLYAVRHGARGFLVKNSSLSRFMAAVRALERGEAVVPRAMVGRLLDEIARISVAPEQDGLTVLTQREMDVLCELGHGSSNRQIADQLDIAENTVKVHVHNILEKLNLRNRRQAARYARFQGLVSKRSDRFLTFQIKDPSNQYS